MICSDTLTNIVCYQYCEHYRYGLVNECLGSGPPQNAPEYRKSNLTNLKIGDPHTITAPHQQFLSPAATGFHNVRS